MFGRSNCGAADNPEFRRTQIKTVKRKNVVRLRNICVHQKMLAICGNIITCHFLESLLKENTIAAEQVLAPDFQRHGHTYDELSLMRNSP